MKIVFSKILAFILLWESIFLASAIHAISKDASSTSIRIIDATSANILNAQNQNEYPGKSLTGIKFSIESSEENTTVILYPSNIFAQTQDGEKIFPLKLFYIVNAKTSYSLESSGSMRLPLLPLFLRGKKVSNGPEIAIDKGVVDLIFIDKGSIELILVFPTEVHKLRKVVILDKEFDLSEKDFPFSNTENNPESHTAKEKLLQPKEAAAPSLKIKVLEEKKKEKVPLEGAGVYLDGKEIGTTDKAGELLTKETIENYHILEVKKSGYFTFKENIEISEYSENKIIILYPGIASSEGADNGKNEDAPETREQVSETPKQGTGSQEQKTDTPKQDVIPWKVSVLKDAGKRKIPVKGAKIFVDDLPFGETDTDGVFKKEVKIGKHILKVECDKFHPFVKEIEISKGADFTEIVLKKRLHSEPEIPEQRTANAPEQRTENKTEKPVLKISVLGDTGMEQISVKGARILINGYLCGETDKDGVFTKRERMGDHTLKVEKNGFYPASKKIEFNEHSDSYEIILKKMSGKR